MGRSRRPRVPHTGMWRPRMRPGRPGQPGRVWLQACRCPASAKKWYGKAAANGHVRAAGMLLPTVTIMPTEDDLARDAPPAPAPPPHAIPTIEPVLRAPPGWDGTRMPTL